MFLDSTTFKNIIIWLETNKIKGAPPNIFNALKNINARDWDNIYIKYKDGLGCPVLETRLEELQWLLGYAIQIKASANSK